MKFIFVISFLLIIQSLHATNIIPEKVKLLLQWQDQFQFAGYYIAKEKGYFKEQNIEIEIIQYNSNLNKTDFVINNDASYAIGRTSLLIDKGNQKKIKILYPAFQSSPFVLISLKNRNLDSLENGRNKSFMISNNIQKSVQFNAILSKVNIKTNEIKIINKTYNIDAFLNKEIDFLAAYSSNEIFKLNMQDIEYNTFYPKDFGFDFYDDILFTSEKEIVNNPTRVQRFKNASIKGWNYAFNNIQESVDIIFDKYNTSNKSKQELLFEAQQLKKLSYTSDGKFAEISSTKLQRIYDIYNVQGLIREKYDVNEIVYNKDALTSIEKNYIKNKKTVNMCVDPNWMPFEKIENKKLIGISADITKLVQEKSGLKFKLIETSTWEQSLRFAKERKCDILSLSMKTKSREKYMNFTNPYLSIPLVIVTKSEQIFVKNFESILDKPLGIVKDYAYAEILKEKYPNINLIEVNTIEEGLEKVNNNDLFALIDNLNSVGYQIQKNYIGSLKISNILEGTWELGFAVRNDDLILHGILNNMVNNMNSNEKSKILNKWINIKYTHNFDYELFFKILFVIFLFLLLLVNRYKVIKSYNIKLEENNAIISKNVMLYKIDTNNNISYISDALCQKLNYKKDDLISKNYKQIIGDTIIDKEITQNKNSFKGEFMKVCDDKSVLWLELNLTKILNNKNIFKGYLIILQDITDKKNLKRLSVTDQLTQISNRLGLDESFKIEVQRSKRNKQNFCTLLLDIDFFKKVNDEYGHDIGDKTLISFTKILRENIRQTDILGRWGGEEFLIICPNTNINNANTLAQKIRNKVMLNSFEKVGNMTISIGISQYSSDDKSNEVIKRADEALYISKDNGRNQVTIKER